MASNWLGSLGSMGLGAVGTAYGGPIGGMAGSYLGGLAGNYLGEQAGLGGDAGGGGGGGFDLGSLFGGMGGGGGAGGQGQPFAPFQFTPQPTEDIFSRAGGYLPNLAGSEVAYNQALQTGLTGVQLSAEEQIAPGTFNLRRGALGGLQRNLDLGYALPPELQDIVMTNALQQLGASGAGTSDLGKLFSARSLIGAGFDRGDLNLQRALAASQFQPSYFTPRQPFGATPGALLAQDMRAADTFGAELGFLNQTRQAAAQGAAANQSNQFQNVLATAGGYAGGAGGGGGGLDLAKIFKSGGVIGGAGAGGGQKMGGFDFSNIFNAGKSQTQIDVEAAGGIFN